MKLVTYTIHGTSRVGVLDEDRVIATRYADMLDLIRSGPSAQAGLRLDLAERRIVDDAQIRAPLPNPGKLLFCGVNFASHQQENPGATLPTVPFFFSKLPSAVIGPDQPIHMPAATTKLDYEVELAVVIGRRASRLTEADAVDHVFGYTIVNDVSARDVQFTDSQITLGKGADTFCPMGPVIVPKADIADPSALLLTTHVNDELRQSEGTSNQLFPIPALLAYLTRHITLEPGDIVSTGTPAGVGHFRTPPAYLRPGDRVAVSIDRIGTLSNPVVAGWDERS